MTENERDALILAQGRKNEDRFPDSVPLATADLCVTCEFIYDRRNPSGCPKCGSTSASTSVSEIWGTKQ